MKRKNKTLIVLIIIFVIVTAAGGFYALSVQGKELKEKETQLVKLRKSYSSIQNLNVQLKQTEEKVAVVDSLLFSGKFTIPQNISQTRFYNFVDSFSGDYALHTFTNTEYVSQGVENGFNFYTYKVFGNGDYDHVFRLINAIEHSKELKKVQSAEINSNTSVDTRGIPRYIVKFNLLVKVYYSATDQYAAVNFQENKIDFLDLYDAFYPLVRTEIRPNIDNLPNIQDATLLSLVPQGAFVTMADGTTLLLKKGDRVYLGYLMDIDYINESITFVLNKGGIIEYETLTMGQNNNRKENKK